MNVRLKMRKVILHDPRSNFSPHSSSGSFRKVPRHKSLLHAPPGKGLPIGNLTSQFLANLYMNELDRYAKHVLKAGYYGRYVDDVMLLHEEPDVLNGWYARMDEFIKSRLAIHFHPNKKQLNLVEKGITFTGFIIKAGRVYLRQSSLSKCQQKIRAWERKGAPVDTETLKDISQSLNSYLGMLRQVNGYNARKATTLEKPYASAWKACFFERMANSLRSNGHSLQCSSFAIWLQKRLNCKGSSTVAPPGRSGDVSAVNLTGGPQSTKLSPPCLIVMPW
jgi:hypothetical protein